MLVTVTSDQQFMEYNGEIFAQALGGYEFWQRYLDIFEQVQVIARMNKIYKLPNNAVKVTGKGVNFLAVPGFVGPYAGVMRLPKILQLMRDIADHDAAFILRVPGAIGTLLSWQLYHRKSPFGVEVVGDPNESLSYTALKKSWTYLLRPLAVTELKRQCRRAIGVTYVTSETLQSRYPSGGKFTTFYSDVELSDEFFESRDSSRTWQQKREPYENTRLIFIGSLSQKYKGLHVLLQAMRHCALQNLKLKLVVLGDGIYLPEYQRLAADLGLIEQVSFLGYVRQGLAVLDHLRNADLFVMPSLVEGLPRAMIEAMATGLPCIGSSIGGIPELLSPEDMVRPNDPNALANKIKEVTTNAERQLAMATRNREKALLYCATELHNRRREFYTNIHAATLAHLRVV